MQICVWVCVCVCLCVSVHTHIYMYVNNNVFNHLQSSVPLLEGPKLTETTENEDDSTSPAIIRDEASSAVDLGHFALPPNSALEIMPLVNQDDVRAKIPLKDNLPLPTISNHMDTSRTASAGIVSSSTDDDFHSDFHSSADSHSGSNSHSDVNPFKRYMSSHQSMSSINRNEPVYIESRDASFWLVSIVTIILSGVVAFIVTKAANRNGAVQVTTL